MRRLRAMSPGEIGWRLRSKAQETVDRCVARRRQRRTPIARIANGNGTALALHGSAFGDQCGLTGGGSPGLSVSAESRSMVIERAGRLMQNRFDFFDLLDRCLGDEVRWNYEYAIDRHTPMGFAPHIDYRDFDVTGDAKVVWEPNRHQHLVALGRAYRLTGEVRYAEKIVEQLQTWIDQCPFGYGMNWRSPLELAIRLINWAWALELIEPSGVLTKERMAGILPTAYRHLWDISRKYSRYSSANNHLIGEAAGVYIGSTYFASLKCAKSRREASRAILIREIETQILGDGGHAELAVGYHQFVLQFFLLAGLVGRRAGDDFPPAYWARLESMFEFLATLSEGGERVPMFGDCDDGYVLDFGSGQPKASELLSVGAALFKRSDFLTPETKDRSPVYWLLGEEGLRDLDRLSSAPEPRRIKSRAFRGSGFYLLQSGSGSGRISVSFDCGELGFGSLAAHGHADALSVTLRACGVDVLVDAGTYDYFTYPAWRNYFRSTRAHNTVVVDGLDQSEMLGSFLWGRRARATCLRFEPDDEGGTVSGRHDGYAALSDPVEHHRTVSLRGDRGEVLVRDELSGQGAHDAALFFHFSPDARVERLDESRYRADCGACVVDISFDSRLSLHAMCGNVDPIGGWVSEGYHRRRPATTLEARCKWRGRLEAETRITISAKH